MKGYNSRVCVTVILLVLLLVPAAMSARHLACPHSRHVRRRLSSSNSSPQPKITTSSATRERRGTNVPTEKFYRKGPDTLQVAGSALPDCSHACGSCTPCRLVMVSFVCATIEEAETCPMAYKCMCKNKSYPVP